MPTWRHPISEKHANNVFYKGLEIRFMKQGICHIAALALRLTMYLVSEICRLRS